MRFLIAKGLTDREIAERLNLSVFTVHNEVISILRALKARNRSHMAFLVGQSNPDVTL